MSNFNLMPFVLTVRTKPLSTYERCGEWCAFCMVKLLGWGRKFLERVGTYLFLDLAFTRRGLSLFSLVFPLSSLSQNLLFDPKLNVEEEPLCGYVTSKQLFNSVFSFLFSHFINQIFLILANHPFNGVCTVCLSQSFLNDTFFVI